MPNWFSRARDRRTPTFGDVSRSVADQAGNGGDAKPKVVSESQPSSSIIEVIPEYTMVKCLVDSGSRTVLVTGGAGTGKSTLIQWLRSQFDGSVIVAAPTGIAALTAGGQTIHSLCGFPPAWLLDSDIKRKSKSPIVKADLVIIDEISMVNANVLDAVDSFFRLNRNSSKPFGGVSVVLVGDLFQLPPIVTSETAPLFRMEYSSPKFFAARALQDAAFDAVELTRPFRQQDALFVSLLSNIREGKDVERTLDGLNSSVLISNDGHSAAVWLSPRNVDVDRLNHERLAELSGKEVTYIAKKAGVFRTNPLPAPAELRVKVGAQVVMASNSQGWVNGSIATVTGVYQDRITIRLRDSEKTFDVPPNTWEQYEYQWSDETERIERVVVGSYTQIPANLAWAMTIHKSQGLSLDAVHLDLGSGAFATGQTYVALSRCRRMETLSLSRPLQPKDVFVDREAVAFYGAIRGNTESLQ